MLDILYEDNHLLVCIKPIGILSQPDTGEGENMMALLSDYLRSNHEKPCVGLVHRLDRNVGGVMVFSKNPNVTGKLGVAIMERDFTKEYLAAVENCPEEVSGIYQDLLFKDSSKNKSFVVKRARKGVKEASLEYSVLETKNVTKGVISLIKIKLHTGRTHQIRVQFSSRKMPLLGDGKYGSTDNGCEIALWSYRLAFAHPINKKHLDFYKEPPCVYPWNEFLFKDPIKDSN
jgi:23S rRNA pseudouridine1911/1915/1917 synthase